jgi:hypothetical protein
MGILPLFAWDRCAAGSGRNTPRHYVHDSFQGGERLTIQRSPDCVAVVAMQREQP